MRLVTIAEVCKSMLTAEEQKKRYAEPWSSSHGRTLMCKKLRVQNPVSDTGWTFFALICCNNCIVRWKRLIFKRQRSREGPFLKIHDASGFGTNIAAEHTNLATGFILFVS